MATSSLLRSVPADEHEDEEARGSDTGLDDDGLDDGAGPRRRQPPWRTLSRTAVAALFVSGAAAAFVASRHRRRRVGSGVRESVGFEDLDTGCRDTPNWSNGWSHCAYEDGGHQPELCLPTPGAAWPSTKGWTCRTYALKGWCGLQRQSSQMLGPFHQFPEVHCCVCGGGQVKALAAPPPSICRNAVEGEPCFNAIERARTEEVKEHPALYPDLTPESPREKFQAIINRLNSDLCPVPCEQVPEACHTAEIFEKCHENVKWAMNTGIYEQPARYPGLKPSSTFEDFQAALHKDPAMQCPSPCPPRPEDEARCYTAAAGEDCYVAVTWAMSEGIYANPDWYPGLQPSSSFEEFQAHINRANSTLCASRPCLVKYVVSPYTAYRAPVKQLMKGMAYGPSPLKRPGVRLANDDFMSNSASLQWAPWGRADLAIMKRLGANTVRMYGNDPAKMKRAFLDQALKTGLDIIVGMSDFPFLQSEDHCSKQFYYCFDQVYAAYKQNLMSGFTIDGYKTYHPALKAVIIMNEPDLKIQPRPLMCRGIISALDGILQAEKELGVTGNPIAFTATFSFAVMGGPPALGQMGELYRCLSNPEAAPTSYKPKNDVLKAYVQRFVNSFNTASPAGVIRDQFMEKYAASGFWSDKIKIPVFIGEYHDVHVAIQQDLQQILKVAQDSRYPFFMGVNFFEYSVRYDKGGTEMEFGMFGFGDCDLAQLPLDDANYTVWDLTPRKDKTGQHLEKALMNAYGGPGLGVRAAALSSSPGGCMRLTPLDSPASLAAGLPTYWLKD